MTNFRKYIKHVTMWTKKQGGPRVIATVQSSRRSAETVSASTPYTLAVKIRAKHGAVDAVENRNTGEIEDLGALSLDEAIEAIAE